MAIPIAIIAVGEHNESAAVLEKVKKLVKATPKEDGVVFLPPIDVRRWLRRNPSGERVFREKDGRHVETQRVVFRQSGFGSVAQEIFDEIVGQYANDGRAALLGLVCTAGVHRSDTLGRLCECAGNMLLDASGARVLNIQFFSTSDCTNPKLALQRLHNAKAWAEGPWTEIPTSAERFGLAAATNDASAWVEWSAFWDHFDGVQLNFAAGSAEEPTEEEAVAATVKLEVESDDDEPAIVRVIGAGSARKTLLLSLYVT